jgi:hypothetical protein
VSKRELRTEVVQSGVWLYDSTVPTDVWIVKQNFEYWYEPDFANAPEDLNEDGDTFQVLFVRGDRRTLGPAKPSLAAAVTASEATVAGRINWTNHIRQELFGGRRYSLAPLEQRPH